MKLNGLEILRRSGEPQRAKCIIRVRARSAARPLQKNDGIFDLRADDLFDDLPRTSSAGPEPVSSPAGRIRVEYRDLESRPDNVLCVMRNAGAAGSTAPLTIDVRLQRLGGPAAEVWYANGPVCSGREGIVRYAHDDAVLIGLIEEDERAYGGIRSAAETLYAAMRQFQEQCGFPHLLRMWNYLDAINEGEDDAERYRQFCVGRALGLGRPNDKRLPAATAIGRQQPTHELQLFWVAARASGTAIENPRQVSAYHYPRAHGPVSPSFSRAMIAPDRTVLVSGTASIVGHVSQHAGDAPAQLAETLRNLAAVTAHAGVGRGQDLLKVYVRDPALVPMIAVRLQEAYPGAAPIFLAGDICRRELLLEIECIHL
jgi:chorismate lyase/3-hydroxybenzoate synthase